MPREMLLSKLHRERENFLGCVGCACIGGREGGRAVAIRFRRAIKPLVGERSVIDAGGDAVSFRESVHAGRDPLALGSAVVLTKCRIPLASFDGRESCIGHAAQCDLYVPVRLLVAIAGGRSMHIQLHGRPVRNPGRGDGFEEFKTQLRRDFTRNADQDLACNLRVGSALRSFGRTPKRARLRKVQRCTRRKHYRVRLVLSPFAREIELAAVML